jgi:hypothetical protein
MVIPLRIPQWEDALEVLKKLIQTMKANVARRASWPEDYFEGRRIVMNMLQDLNLT